MGACNNLSRKKTTIRANILDNNKSNTNSDLISKMSHTSLSSKNQIKLDTTHSNLSSNSTCTQIYPSSDPYFFTLSATIGEIEVPILVERNEKIIIKINNNENNYWSFLKNEKTVLCMRITGDNKIYSLNKIENHIIANDKGTLLFFANLNKNDYLIYEPKGSLNICIYGGNYSVDNGLYHSNNINSFSNKNKIDLDYKKEYKILDYINKARNNPKIFYHNYFSNIFDDINLEFKEFIYKNKKSKELKINKELNNLARKHCEVLCENETAGDIGTDDLDIIDRIKNFKKDCYYYGENIIYNINNPLLIVKSMMIDKYSKKKKNRNNLFFDKYKNIGMFLKEHPIYKYCCVFIFSE